MKVVALLPGATEIVCALGLEGNLVGISHSCDYPPEIRSRAVLTSTRVPVRSSQQAIDLFVRDQLQSGDSLYQLDIDRLEALAPDFIITQTLCDVCAVSAGDVYEALASLPHPAKLIELAPSTLKDVYQDIKRIGTALAVEAEAEELVASLQQRARAVRDQQVLRQSERVLFLEWLSPPFIGGHWIPDLIELLGGESCLLQSGQRSASVSWSEIQACDPDIIVIACCGFNIEESSEALALLEGNPDWLQLRAVVEGKVFVADGNAHFSRAGPRLIDGLEWLAEQFN